MSKYTKAFMLAAALSFVPAYASAEISLADSLEDMDVNQAVVADDATGDIAHPGHPGPHHGPGPGHHVVYHEVRHYRTNVRPRVIHPVVVVERPATVVVSDSQPEPVSEFTGSKFGLGVRGAMLKQSPIQLIDGSCLGTQLAGGVGYYIKVRPVRWFSLEFINDFIFGSYDHKVYDIDGYELNDKYAKIPISLGVRAHVFDYGQFDLYGVAAASLTFNSLDRSSGAFDDAHFIQFGGQFGGGVSFIAAGFEFGLDLRYTIDEAPDSSIYGRDYVNQDEPIHGMLFSLNIGYAL